MITIHKFPLELKDVQVIPMAITIPLFKVGLDPKGQLCVWARVDTNSVIRDQTFFIVGTGHPVPDKAYVWVGTVTQGDFVWHIWTP